MYTPLVLPGIFRAFYSFDITFEIKFHFNASFNIPQSPRPSYWVVYDDYDTLTWDDSSYLLLGSESQKPSNAFCIVSRFSAVVLTAHLQWILGQQKRYLCCSLSFAQNQTQETRYKTEFGNILPARVVKGINDKFSVITKFILPVINKARQGC